MSTTTRCAWCGADVPAGVELCPDCDDLDVDEVLQALPVGTVEIAAACGVTREAVVKWRQRNLGFPRPRWQVGGSPAWEWREVAAWLVETGRHTPTPPAMTGEGE